MGTLTGLAGGQLIATVTERNGKEDGQQRVSVLISDNGGARWKTNVLQLEESYQSEKCDTLCSAGAIHRWRNIDGSRRFTGGS